jgi:hypothetical protein
MEALRTKGAEPGLQIFIVEKDENATKALEFDIVACPALLLFWKGPRPTSRGPPVSVSVPAGVLAFCAGKTPS